jgi:hypothetical protein
VNALRVTPRQLFEASRVLDRSGDGILTVHEGVLTLLVVVFGVGSPNLALELDRDGEVIARQVLSLRRQEPEDEFSEEEPLVYVDPYSEGAKPAPRCECPSPRADDGTCGVCGHSLPEAVAEAA